MPEPTPPTPPTPAGITDDTPLSAEHAKQYGAATFGELLAKHNDLNGRLANPKAPESYDYTVVQKHYTDAGLEFKADDPAFAGIITAMREGAVSQTAFDRIVPKMQAELSAQSKAAAEAWEKEATEVMGGAENLQNLKNAAAHYGLGDMVIGASPEQLVNFTNMINAAAGAGGLTAPQQQQDPNAPPQDTPPESFEGEWSVEYNDKRYGFDPKDKASIDRFLQLQIETTMPNGQKSSRPLHEVVPSANSLYKKALVWRANNGYSFK